jgi:hypothetical protein
MAHSIALSIREFPSCYLERPEIRRRLYGRGGEQEIRFQYRDPSPCLPVWHQQQFILARWGNTLARRASPPAGGWVWKEELVDKLWSNLETHEVRIFANAGCENQVWYRIRHGIEGLLIENDDGPPIVYMLMEPASHYFRAMTRSARMPVLVGEVI